MGKVKTYRVKWEIDVQADRPETAALQALTIMQDKDSTAVIFDITGGGLKNKVSVDLEDYAVCDNCSHIIHLGDQPFRYAEIKDLFNRIEPGGVVPSCECPKCHALAYPAKRMLDEMKT